MNIKEKLNYMVNVLDEKGFFTLDDLFKLTNRCIEDYHFVKVKKLLDIEDFVNIALENMQYDSFENYIDLVYKNYSCEFDEIVSIENLLYDDEFDNYIDKDEFISDWLDNKDYKYINDALYLRITGVFNE